MINGRIFFWGLTATGNGLALTTFIAYILENYIHLNIKSNFSKALFPMMIFFMLIGSISGITYEKKREMRKKTSINEILMLLILNLITVTLFFIIYYIWER